MVPTLRRKFNNEVSPRPHYSHPAVLFYFQRLFFSACPQLSVPSPVHQIAFKIIPSSACPAGDCAPLIIYSIIYSPIPGSLSTPDSKIKLVIHTRCSSSLPPTADAAIAACSLSFGSIVFSSLETFDKSRIWRWGAKKSSCRLTRTGAG
ncbi:hypothetical protein PILCRDRAFT_256790 [Piloderma croceum F 1598]|uniref:Uncharacterized protein n=1 Tax=Piloderma croceum (strain F 1598) TaxID=765440 RepID=A0A0C3GCR9_PILCF|nr:hypothetical protein PILCRDRAFT_256790 [Piloderma croceum F 1598]